jgi:predicted transcriptional regulator
MITLQEMTSALLDSGMTEAQLAEAVKTSQATVHRIRRGTTPDPGYSLGKRIEAIYESVRRELAVGAE